MEYSISYSIIVVCLNAGKRLMETIESIRSQTYGKYEIIIKDGMSMDGSLDSLIQEADRGDSRIRIHSQADKGIYDAMNQAVGYAKGDYLFFLNAGDSFYDKEVLYKITEVIERDKPDIVYGNLYHKALHSVIQSAPAINDFTCYRNVPCHQTCFYRKELFAERGYNPVYNVRADYEHFLWCYYKRRATALYAPVIVAAYEGGGYSETAENKRRSAAQHREITRFYMGRAKAGKYRMLMTLSLAPLRTKMAESEKFSGFYNRVKSGIYKVTGKGR